MLRFLTAGESHGPALVVTVEGMPAGLPILVDDIAAELARRRLGYGRGPADAIRSRTSSSSSAGSGTAARSVRRSRSSSATASGRPGSGPRRCRRRRASPRQPLTQPRPGHADLAGMQKYGFTDARDVLERASARETAARVAAGALAKALLRPLGISVLSHVVQLGAARRVARPASRDPTTSTRSTRRKCAASIPTPRAEMIREIKEAAKAGDSLGGVVEVLGFGIPPGLGSHVHWDRRIDGLLAQALMSIQAMKAVEIGEGFTVAGGRGQRRARRDRVGRRRARVPPRVVARGRDRRRHDDRRSARGARRR